MSLILDALSRAERDKLAARSDTPDILSQSPAQPVTEAPATVRRRWILGLFTVVLLLLLGIAVMLGDRPDSSTVHPAQTTSVPVSATASATENVPAATVVPARKFADATESMSSAALVDTATASPAEQKSREASIAALYALPESSKVSLASSAQVPAPNAQPGRPNAVLADEDEVENQVDEEIDLAAILAQVKRETAATELVTHPAPLLEDMSKQFRDRVPTLMYLRHDFNSLGLSTVLINGASLRVGQRTRNVEVREILEDSAVLRFDGSEFRLRALNSWVNL
ncbi:MAG: general secretion pathway protein GspB [Congregibacter sp.]